MKTTIQKWGNSLAVRIPRLLAAETGLKQNSLVELSMVEGKLVINPHLSPCLHLEALVSAITPENLHAETNTGKPAGREAW